MAEKAKQRLQAIGKQLAPAIIEDEAFDNVPSIKQVAPPSNGPRAQGKVVIITGANSPLGIGRATAHQFAQNGAKAVYICDFDDKYLGYHERQITSLYPGVEVHTRKFDAADEPAVKEVVGDALRRYGRLDVMFANAGITGDYVLFSDTSEEDFMKVLRVNTLGPFLAAKHAAPAMAKTSTEKPQPGGSIIMTASVAGIRSNAGPTPYSASKSAVINMASTMAYQLAGSNIRVNAICPGVVETGMTAPMYETARARGTEKKIGQLNPMKRGSAADEVARVALFLGSDESSYVNGQSWAVDGGLSAGHPYVAGKIA
ncbi:3-oxoacyl-[acyl-carrier-protein] reductase FabG [Cytospora mali]|uniref:3-oxoacyl-[acyl-carrier-protein] reductase FabG n=1 Tax=Cytospora mali TaxID=578113 RepID=A0A194VU77_CYTMA|nr:3-oxoacyl-[acyl-carrier-protein] reductase FabG [Valsa mali]